MSVQPSRDQLYARLIERIFFTPCTPGITEFVFRRDEIEEATRELGLAVLKDIDDLAKLIADRSGGGLASGKISLVEWATQTTQATVV